MYKEYHLSSVSAFNPLRPSWPIQGAASIAKYRILSVSFPATHFSVDSDNNTVVFNENGATYTAKLPIGHLTADTGPAALQAAMNAVSPVKGYAVAYVGASRGLEIRNAGVADFSIQTALGGSSAYLLLGLPRFGLPLRPENGVLKTSVCQFGSTVPLLLSSTNLATPSTAFAGQENLNILCQIPPAQEGAMCYYEPNGSWLEFGREVSEIDFVLLRASNLQPIDLRGGILSVTLGVLTDADDVAL
jgi:hypothetical protein